MFALVLVGSMILMLGVNLLPGPRLGELMVDLLIKFHMKMFVHGHCKEADKGDDDGLLFIRFFNTSNSE